MNMEYERRRIECPKEQDRDALATILFRCGYTVRRVREKKGNGNTYIYYVEYWKEQR